MHGGLALFNPADFGHSGTRIEIAGKEIQLVPCAHGIGMNPAVVLIADPASEPNLGGAPLHKPAESNALNAAGHPPFARLNGFCWLQKETPC